MSPVSHQLALFDCCVGTFVLTCQGIDLAMDRTRSCQRVYFAAFLIWLSSCVIIVVQRYGLAYYWLAGRRLNSLNLHPINRLQKTSRVGIQIAAVVIGCWS